MNLERVSEVFQKVATKKTIESTDEWYNLSPKRSKSKGTNLLNS